MGRKLLWFVCIAMVSLSFALVNPIGAFAKEKPTSSAPTGSSSSAGS